MTDSIWSDLEDYLSINPEPVAISDDDEHIYDFNLRCIYAIELKNDGLMDDQMVIAFTFNK